MKIIDIVHVHQLKKRQDLIWHQRYHKHDINQYEFHYFLEGEGSLFIKDDKLIRGFKQQFKKFELFLILPEVYHAIQCSNRHVAPVSYYAILFELEPKDSDLKQNLEDPLFYSQFPFHVSHRNHLIFKVLLEQRMQVKNRYLHVSAEHKLYSYLYELFASQLPHNDKQLDSRILGRTYNFHIDRAVDYMHKRVLENISIETIAMHIGVSLEYLIRLFNIHLNTTPYYYFIQLKLEECCGLLTNTNMKILEISEKFNFSNSHNFSRLFKRQIGISPTAFRNKYLHSVGILANSKDKVS